MASKDYDQYDNEYKEIAAAKAVEQKEREEKEHEEHERNQKAENERRSNEEQERKNAELRKTIDSEKKANDDYKRFNGPNPPDKGSGPLKLNSKYKIVNTIAHHVNQSYNDVFLTPLKVPDKEGKLPKRQQNKNVFVGGVLSSVSQPRGKIPRGLLDLGNFAAPPRTPPQKKKSKRTTKKAQARQSRSSLDDMLFF